MLSIPNSLILVQNKHVKEKVFQKGLHGGSLAGIYQNTIRVENVV